MNGGKVDNKQTWHIYDLLIKILGGLMEIIFYIFLLLICEIFVYSLIIGTDYYLKSKNYKLIKRSKLMFKSKYGDDREISKVIYWFQIFNYIYILIYLLIAAVDIFAYKSSLLFKMNFYSIIIYTILVIIFLIIISILSPKKEIKK